MEFWDQILEPVLGDMDKDIKNLKEEMNNRFDRTDYRLDKLESGQSDLSRQLNDVKMDTPTRKEFIDLKSRVDKLEHFRTAN